MTSQYGRRVGAVRPSHLMFTSGVGSLVDLPNLSVLVRGLDDWSFANVPDFAPIDLPRLREAIHALGPAYRRIDQLRPAPWLSGLDRDPTGPAANVGVPVTPFPTWLRCTACNRLGPVESREFGFDNRNPRRPHEARFFHQNCGRKRSGRRPLAVPARFVLACTVGHLDDFPYRMFVHRGADCAAMSHPPLEMDDRGGNLGANVEIRCVSCSARRNIREAMGERGWRNLPACRGRHPHLATFSGCDRKPKLLVVGASNQWFAQTLSALAVPRTGTSELEHLVEQHWSTLEKVINLGYLEFAFSVAPRLAELKRWTNQEILDAIEAHRVRTANGTGQSTGYPDLRTPEWEIFSAEKLPEAGDDFALRRDPDGVPAALSGVYADVVQAERLREVRALVGFTRLDAPDPDDPELVTSVRLARDDPTWVPASEVRGEGIFLRLGEDLLAGWEKRVDGSAALEAYRDAYARFRRNRYSGRIPGSFDPMRLWPGARYIALHTLSHLLIRTIALECGYNSASLSERIYAGSGDDPRSGILIYTAVPDAEGTLGGLVSLSEPDNLVRLTRRALADARHCSSDPLCAERLPAAPADFLHGAACHVCLFVSETTCERGNRFLDRRFVVPVAGDGDGGDGLALYPGLP
ncbi:MAG TPA: DUF1998 domain-containing protein [Mycobacteriales bacterium]|nr:DUF1998 domain-containing protein [Mycobacteriales bacterium]